MKKGKWLIPACIALSAVAVLAVAQTSGWWKNAGAHELPDAKTELKRLYALYMRADTSMYVSGTIHLYDEEKIDELKETTAFASFRNGTHFYSRFGHLQTLGEDSLVVLLDTLNKRIVLSKMDKESLSNARGGIFPFESYLEDTATFRISADLSEKNGQRVLVIRSDLDPGIASCSIAYDPASGQINNAEIRWRKDNALPAGKEEEEKCWLTKIRYEYKPAARVNIKELMEKIIVVKDGKIVTTPAYSGYELGNNSY